MSRFTDLLQTLNIRTLASRVTGHERRITSLEVFVATHAELISQIDSYANTLAVRIEDLQSRIAAGDTAAVAALLPVAEKLRQLAADPDAVVPSPLPDEEPPSGPTPVPTDGI